MPDSDKLYKAVLETAVDAIVTIDEGGVVLACNPAATRIFGYAAREMIGRNVSLLMPEPQRSEHDSYIARFVETGERRIIGRGREVVGRRKDGSLVPLELSVSVVHLEGRRVFTGILRDASKRRAAEETSDLLYRSLEEKNRELQSIVYVASHDLRSPLVNIQGFSRELSRACAELKALLGDVALPGEKREQLRLLLDEDIPESLQFILVSAAKMDGLLSGLLRLSRLGRMALDVRTLDMNALVEQVVASFAFRLEECGGRVERSELPPCRGDAPQISQVFLNLVDNAIKYRAPERPLHVRIEGTRDGAGGVVYRVEDNGIGIAPEHRLRVFEVFHRLDNQRAEGEGLGLTIAQRILARLEGSIAVADAPGPGARFEVRLPAAGPKEERGS